MAAGASLIEAPDASPTTKRARFGGSIHRHLSYGDHQEPNTSADADVQLQNPER